LYLLGQFEGGSWPGQQGSALSGGTGRRKKKYSIHRPCVLNSGFLATSANWEIMPNLFQQP
jgi:hypothetical protein